MPTTYEQRMLAFLETHAVHIRTPLDVIALLVHVSAAAHGLCDIRAPLSTPWHSSAQYHARTYHTRERTYDVVVVQAGRCAVLLVTTSSSSQVWKSECILEDVVQSASLPWDATVTVAAMQAWWQNEAIVSQLCEQWDRDVWHPAMHDEERAAPSSAPATSKAAVQGRSDEAKAVPFLAATRGMPTDPRRLGDADRDPLAASPYPFPGTGSFQPPPLFPSSNDGMMMGPNHPIFARRAPPPHGAPPMGPDGLLPPGAVPPGARFDPMMPWDPSSSRASHPSGDPDWDDLPPPSSMFS
ncbi:endopeptidase inhibitor [Malassezia pachydermatis]|uniref:PI31 proteasome regulator C-terminal domain-containing protein n=1 Tax=Malassezia pachydermatis TaxID=77020 RepID=A0A0M8MMG0_9BASI|nr:hypothetical protein Malapachy_2724 [Malassezia pachydermatis]KOS15446.1 hypothetical protein Malapachy_2724 [Malassezia pachydermatis]